MSDPAPAPPDDPLIAAWIAHLAAHPEATPQHRRFARWVRRLWAFYVRHPALWRGIVYLHVRSGEPCEIRGFDEGA
jgi:hypothetical protein